MTVHWRLCHQQGNAPATGSGWASAMVYAVTSKVTREQEIGDGLGGELLLLWLLGCCASGASSVTGCPLRRGCGLASMKNVGRYATGYSVSYVSLRL